jgi:polysaccharide export outer membrane protein
MKHRLCERFAAAVFLAAIITGTVLTTRASGQEVRIRSGDRLRLDVPQREQLGSLLTVDDSGDVSIAIVGRIRVAGSTLDEARLSILRALQDVYPSVQSITLTLIGEEARRIIFVQGQVVRPGKIEFAGAPNIWEAIREAGGTTALASLGTVRLIRAEGTEERTSIINVQRAIDSGDFSSLPVLRPGDTVIVPERTPVYSGSGAVNIIGAVRLPAPYSLTGGRRLIDAVLAAGGPTENAKLNSVTVIRTLPEGGQLTMLIDFEAYLNTGDIRHNPVILPDDTVNVPPRDNYWRRLFMDPALLIGFVTAAVTTAAILSSD